MAEVTRADMSPAAIDRRLRELGQLFKLGIALREARWLGGLKDDAAEPCHREDREGSAPGPHGDGSGASPTPG